MTRDALRLTTYFGERDRAGDAFLADALIALYARHELRASLVMLMIIAIGAGKPIAAALDELRTLLRDPLYALERVRVCKRDGPRLAEPRPVAATDPSGLAVWQKLMVYCGEQSLQAAAPPRPDRHRDRRYAGAHPALVRHRRRAHRPDGTGHQRAGSGAPRHRPGVTRGGLRLADPRVR